MTSQAVAVRVRRLVHRSALLQVGLLLAFWAAGEGVVRLTGLPLPGGVVGMALVLALLAVQRLRPGSLQRGSQWLLGDMLLFFVPAVLAVLNHQELLGVLGLKLLAIILVGTAAVMGVTALTVELCTRAAAHAARNSLG
jgi:holin-like protein